MCTNLQNESCSHIQKHHYDRFFAGDCLYWRCEYEKAREHFQYILNNSRLTDSDLARCYKSLAAVKVELKNYDEAIDTYEKQLDVLRKMCDSTSTNEDIVSCYISIGKVYWLKGDYDQSIQYHHQALGHATDCQASQSCISSIYKNLANIYTNAKQFDSALKYFDKALQIDCERNPINNLQVGQTYANMGGMYQLKQNYEEALDYLKKARATLLKTVSETHVAIEKIDKTISKIIIEPNIQPVNSSDILAHNNIIVLWLDKYIGCDENCRELKMKFRQITNSFKMFDSVDNFRKCLHHVKDRKVFCIIQGKYAKEVVPEIVRIVSPSMEPVVYIFCLHMEYLVDWAVEQECVMRGGMDNHELDLLGRLRLGVKDYVEQNKIDDEKKISSELVKEFLEQFLQISKDFYEKKPCKLLPIQLQLLLHNKSELTT